MTEETVEAPSTSLIVLEDLLLDIPEGTLLRDLFSKKGPLEILPVVGVLALESVVVGFVEGTEFGFEVEVEKLVVLWEQVQEVDFNVRLRVGQRAEVSENALFALQHVQAELLFIVVWVVQLLQCVVCERTRLLLAVLLRTHRFRIVIQKNIPSSLFV